MGHNYRALLSITKYYTLGLQPVGYVEALWAVGFDLV